LALLVGALAVAAAALAGCAPPERAHDVAYYRDHGGARIAKLAACRGDPGRPWRTPNCVNALAADTQAESRRFWTVRKPTPRVVNPGSL
jgi:hypothetical protein